MFVHIFLYLFDVFSPFAAIFKYFIYAIIFLLDELRQLIKRQKKQKESLECELEKEREKLQMIRLDIITLTSPVMTHMELKELCDEIARLRNVCGRLADEIDVATGRK